MTSALVDGARRSWEACSVPAADPLVIRVWRRHKWKIIAVALFVLFDLVVLGAFGTITTHF